MKQVRVRFAPSPTGELHIGGVRTALFNWLFARHHKGKFILRIEDTDVLRSQKDFITSVIENLNWLGLNWDEGPGIGGDYGPYFQSQRLDIYKRYAKKLLREGKAYPCYCTQEELLQRRRKMQREGKPPVYDGHCRDLSLAQREKLEREGRKSTVRFKVPHNGTVKVRDLLRGDVNFENKILGDFIILKSDGTPTFNFANVVDDYLMRITCVIRGDDHLSNTPRQILIYQALNFDPPSYAHIPMILGKDGAKLSKRHGATSITYYREKGYLPWAVVNYLSLLGWSTPDSQQFFTKEELIKKFSLERVGKSSAVFDYQKLEWMNAEYIRKMDTDELAKLLIPYLKKRGWVKDKVDSITYRKIFRITELEKDRLRTLSDIVELADFFFEKDFVYDSKAVKKKLKNDYVCSLLRRVKNEVEQLSKFDEENLERTLRKISKELSLSTAKAFHPLRIALTGRMRGPGLFELAAVLGRKEVLRRIDRTLEMLKEKGYGGSASGRPQDSGSCSGGSNPPPPAKLAPSSRG